MYNNSKCNYGCNNMMGKGCMNNCNMNSNYPCPAPIVAQKRVCVTQSNRYIEQPVICPIECRHIQNLSYYPRYYPRYEQTYVTRDANGNIISSTGTATNGSMYGGATAATSGSTAANFGATNMGTATGNTFGTTCGNSFKNGCGC